MIPIIFLLALVASGCSTTRTVQPPTETKLQMRVVQLENKVEEREKDIEDLRSEIDEISRQMETKSAAPNSSRVESIPGPSTATATQPVTNYLYGDIIRVDAHPQDIQTALKNAGYYNGNVDGKLGQNSQKAIRDFQADHNLQADGVIGRKTWAELKNFLK